MMKRHVFALIGLAIFLLAAPTMTFAAARITDAAMGLGATDSDEIVNPTTQFAPDTARIFCTWVAKGIEGDTNIRGVWIAEDVGDVAPANYKIDEASVKLPSNGTGKFSMSKPNAGFPVGKYRVEIYLNDDLAKTVKFTVKAK